MAMRSAESRPVMLEALPPDTVSIRQHTSAYVSIREHTVMLEALTPDTVSIRQHT